MARSAPALHSHHNLPTHATALVGRDREVADLRQLLLSDDGRLVTLTGVGGCGKTRLALGVASSVIGSFKDGVWLVELAALADPLLVPQAIASVLGVRERSDRSLLDALVAYLARRQVLLVLDNCEHLVKVCAELADTLLHGCPGVRLLATSREPLQSRANEPGAFPRWPSPIRIRSCIPTNSCGIRRRSCSSNARSGGAVELWRDSRAAHRCWRPSVPDWRACRWRSNWPRRGCVRSGWSRFSSGWTTRSGCWSAAAG